MDADLRDFLDAKLDPMADDIRELKTDVAAQNGRVGSLERWRAYITGGLAMAALFAGGSITAWMAVIR